jgi:hypothetical protein
MNNDTPLEEQLCKVADETRKVTDRLAKEASDLSRESRELLRESARLQRESVRLQKVARLKEERSVQLRTDCGTIRHLQETSALERLCCSLQQNDPRISTLDLERLQSILPGNYTETIGVALRGNTHIASMMLTGSIVDRDDTEVSKRKATPFIHYIRTSNSIRQVALNIYDERLTSEILIAIGNSPSVEQLTLENVLPPAGFHHLMATTRSLKTLVFNVNVGDLYLQNSDWMVQAFSVNKTLQSLTIGHEAGGSLQGHLGPVLKGIALSGTNALRVLDLYCGRWWSVESTQEGSLLCQVLRTINSLRHLMVEGMHFNKELMREFVGCLRKPTNSDLKCSSITKLSFSYCYGVDLQFIELMRSKTIQGDKTSSWTSSLLELSVLSTDNVLQPLASARHGTHKDESNGNNQDMPYYCPTIAEQLTWLHITLKHHTVQLFLPHPSIMRFEELHLHSTDQSDCNELENVIPYLPFLKILCMETTYDPNDVSQIILDVLRQSGNLHSTSICQDRRYGGLRFHPDNVQMASAYCERNQQMHMLLLDTPSSLKASDNSCVSPSHMNISTKALYPLLLAVTKQFPTLRLGALLAFLLRIGDGVGSNVAAPCKRVIPLSDMQFRAG